MALVAGPCGEELGRRGVAGPLERVLGRSEVEFGLALGFYREREKGWAELE